MMEASAVCFRALEELTGPGWQVHSLLGFIYRQMDLLEVSLGYYDKALDSGGPRDELLFDRAIVLVRLGRLDEAAEAFRRFSEGPKGSCQSWNDLGAVLEAQGRLDEAMAAYDRAIDLDPDYYIALYSKGKLLQKRGSMDEARPVIQRALDLESRVFDINDIRSSKEAPEEGTVKVKQVMRRGPASQ
jgi:tetratricopeptide (TPR) repeat protein